jgi:chromosome partitioning protein
MIIVVAALKGGVGKTTTSVYLSALAAARNASTLIDADPQASAAEWLETVEDDQLASVSLVEAPTDRLLLKVLDRVEPGEVAVVDTPPGNERLLAKAMERADVIVVPTRIGGVETVRVEAVLSICSARTYTRDYQDTVSAWTEANVEVWGSIPERVSIAAGPESALAPDGLDAYRAVWRRVLRAARG